MTALASISNLPALQPYVASAIVLTLNAIGLANATALTRAKADEVINPEDAPRTKKANVVYEGGNDMTARYRRAHRNALENTPFFMITALLLTMMGTSATVGGIVFGGYAVARVLHSVCYVKGVQPFRTIFFVLGSLLQLAVLGLIGYGSLA